MTAHSSQIHEVGVDIVATANIQVLESLQAQGVVGQRTDELGIVAADGSSSHRPAMNAVPGKFTWDRSSLSYTKVHILVNDKLRLASVWQNRKLFVSPADPT